MNQNFRFLLMLLLACLILGNGVLLTGQAQSPVVSDDVDEPDGPDLTDLTSPGLVPLVRRHPYAGVYSVWDGELKGRDLDNYPFLKGVHLYTKWATLKPDQNGPYRWELLDQVVREKTGGDDDVRLYLQVNAHWPDWIFDHIAISTFSKRDQRIPQFWDPLYLGFYQQFIRDLAAYIAQAPYKDRIVLVRAQFNAFTPESISPDGYFSYQTYLPTAGGHRYPVNYNYTLGDRYARAVTQTYLEAFTPLGILVVQKPFSNTGHDQTIAAEYAGMGAGLFATNNGPNPLRRQTIYRLSTSLQTRSFSEPGRLGHCVNQPSEDKLRFIYWSALSALHQGVEFISFYGCDIINPRYRGIFEFADSYAGWYRKPKRSPGAWIAFREMKNSPERAWMDYLPGNYEYLIKQIEPEGSVGLFAYPGAGNLDKSTWQPVNELNPLSRPVTDLGPKSQKEGVWARRTNDQPIYLNLDDIFVASLSGPITLKVTYFDQGTGQFELVFRDGAGVVQSYPVEKQNTLRWKKFTLTAASYQFANDLSKNADLLLDPAGDDDDIFHMVEITRGGVASRADEDSLELAPEAESLPQLPLEADPDEPLFPPDPASPEPLPAEPTTEPPTPTETPLPDAALETPLPIETALFMEISLPLITPAAEAAASATPTLTPEPPPTETATSSPEPVLTATPTAETAASATPTLTPEPPPTETATPSPTDTPSPIPQPTNTPTLAVTPAP